MATTQLPNIVSSDYVRALAIQQLKELEAFHNLQRKLIYQQAIENWKLNFYQKGVRLPVPQPPLAIHYQYKIGEQMDEVITTEGPDFVAEPFVPPEKAPWEQDFPEGVVDFGPPAGDGSGILLAGPKNTVPPGTHATKDGREYVFVVLGQPGTLNYRKLWVPTGK